MENKELIVKSHHDAHDEHHEHTLKSELECHFPYAVFSVAFSLIAMGIMSFIAIGKDADQLVCAWDQLFHSFHFLHIIFASVGVLLTYFRYSKNLIKGLIVGFFSASTFCILSDIIVPYLGGKLLGVDMELHVCFYYELRNVLPFLLVGLLTGLVLRKHTHDDAKTLGLWSHFTHIFVSSLASSFYMVSHGFEDWALRIGYVFLVLIIAVIIPCTLSDVVVPMTFAKLGKK